MSNEWDAVSDPAKASEWDAVSTPDRRAPATERRKFVPPAEMDLDPRSGMSGYEKFMVGAGYEADKAIRGLKEVFTPKPEKTLSSLIVGDKKDQGQEDADLYQKYRPKGWQTTAGEIFGAAGSRAPAALIPGGLAVQMAAQGAQGAAMTPGDLKERAKAGAGEAAGTLGGHVLSNALGRVAKPIGDKADDIVRLEAQGVRPTFGQGMAAGDTAVGRTIGRMEEAAQSVPLASGPLRRTREASVDQWRQATRNAAMPPGTTGAGSVDEVRQAVSTAYNNALDPIPMPYASVTYQPDIRRLTAGQALTNDQRRLLQETFDELRLSHMQNPTPGVQPTAAAAQQIESALKTRAAEFRNSGDPAQRNLGRGFRALAEDFGGTWRSSLPPGVRQTVADIDRIYPNKMAIEQAARTVGVKASDAVPSNYTPAVLHRASRTVDRSPGKAAYIRGDAPMQEQARLGEHLMPKMNDSGTTERGLAAAVMTGLPGFATAAATGLPLAGYGLPGVQNYMMGRAMPRTQQAILDALRTQQLGGAAGAGAASLFDYGD